MSRIRLTPMGPGHFGVQVDEGHQVTSHEVVVDGTLIDDLGLAGYDPRLVAAETVAFLLDRHPATALDERISVRDVDRYYPDFREELIARTTARGEEPD